jgi:ribonucleoside-diphosphate reductase subunit M2
MSAHTLLAPESSLAPSATLAPSAQAPPAATQVSPAAARLFLKPDIVAAVEAGDESIFPVSGVALPVPDGGSRPAREALWLAAFPLAAAKVVVAASRLFPATSLETFKRWLTIRSDISPEDEAQEVLFQPEPARSSLFPIIHSRVWECRKTLERLNWMAQEVDLDNDARDLLRATIEEINLLFAILGFFGIADELIMEGLEEVATLLFRTKEGQYYLRTQNSQECVHSEAYSLQIQAVVPAKDRQAVFDAVLNNPDVARMRDWVRWWILAEHPGADFVAVMANLEGVLFSGFFAVIQFFKTRNLFHGITSMNEFICRDENKHTETWCIHLAELLTHRPSLDTMHQIAYETVTLSSSFFVNAIPSSIVGMNSALLTQHVSSVADSVLVRCGYGPMYHTNSPFAFMDALRLNIVAKTNFFEHRPSMYQMATEMTFEVDLTPICGDMSPIEEDVEGVPETAL